MELINFDDSLSAFNFARMISCLGVYANEILHMDINELNKKQGVFSKFFSQNLFNLVTHKSSTLIPTREDGKSVLLSPHSLTGKNSSVGKVNNAIGNSFYIFANFAGLRSFNLYGDFEYFIDSRDCRVVPVDVAHSIWPDDENACIQIYSQNILNYLHFIKFFSLYCAIIFDSPDQAIDIINQMIFRRFSDQGPWDQDFLTRNSMRFTLKDESQVDLFPILSKMIDIQDRYNIVPPINPELQFKDSVEAVRVD